MTINLHLLRMFFPVVEHGGFSHVAPTLNVSQSAVSKDVKEGQLGGPSLERHAGMQPTETGAVLLRNVKAFRGRAKTVVACFSTASLDRRDKRRTIGERI
jgi:DNA-binding transcriptional LysR family regulator